MSSQGETNEATFFQEGFIFGEKGQTNFASSKSELDKLRKTDYVVSFVNPKDLQESFQKGKSVFLIGIPQAIFDKIDDIARNQASNPKALKYAKWTPGMTLNLITDAAWSIMHEEMAHAIKKIKSNKDVSDPLTDQKEYNGEMSLFSPSLLKVFSEKKYKNTKAFKSLEQIMNAIQKRTDNKIIANDEIKNK